MIDSGLAIAAGIVTVASPCTLPLLPIVFTLAAHGTHPKRPYAIVGGFVGVKTLSVILIALAGSFLGLSTSGWRTVSAIFFALFGIISLIPALSTVIFGGVKNLLAKIDTEKTVMGNDLPSAFIGGALLALVWAPCAGPALGSIAILIASGHNLVRGVWLLFLFALGVGIPMFLIAYFGSRAAQALRKTNTYLTRIQQVFGALLILISLMLFTGADITFQQWMLQHAPDWYVSGNWRL